VSEAERKGKYKAHMKTKRNFWRRILVHDATNSIQEKVGRGGALKHEPKCDAGTYPLLPATRSRSGKNKGEKGCLIMRRSDGDEEFSWKKA